MFHNNICDYKHLKSILCSLTIKKKNDWTPLWLSTARHTVVVDFPITAHPSHALFNTWQLILNQLRRSFLRYQPGWLRKSNQATTAINQTSLNHPYDTKLNLVIWLAIKNSLKLEISQAAVSMSNNKKIKKNIYHDWYLAYCSTALISTRNVTLIIRHEYGRAVSKMSPSFQLWEAPLLMYFTEC